MQCECVSCGERAAVKSWFCLYGLMCTVCFEKALPTSATLQQRDSQTHSSSSTRTCFPAQLTVPQQALCRRLPIRRSPKTPRTLLPNNKHDTLVVDRPVHGHSVCALQGHLAHLKGGAPVGARCFEFASTLALDLLLENAAHDLIKGGKGAKGRLDDR